jgi:hypothetical protein
MICIAPYQRDSAIAPFTRYQPTYYAVSEALSYTNEERFMHNTVTRGPFRFPVAVPCLQCYYRSELASLVTNPEYEVISLRGAVDRQPAPRHIA